ncbi:DUF922 domain-containing protein [Mesorhizobium sp. M2D.F.Ca.ET.185.01.1.1]|uniref:DUF922 domain-containing protein n=2 Tax=Mesorhizobium TaxID=68287 RepID=UPI000FC9CE5E|nr:MULTISPECIES: DUF922 domain-containing protein [unclassified Mesorhizobium]TGP57021.1 DUF922 domain-containing protein [bacterium M00.F.Ca.ET.230.01.1.1]TGP76358.1 DUF922 domain-containing protein [bacterium M00.F.Ca.ET.227.01.1.1]TGP92410.1 DUF922 domain-containing protein [bacterium M00.F.Ca.ET.222.01.1.1]TGP96965.1 DUF922 domain-containing protein [bacterium M00.F.Ca.ET.221.01.1.1]TGT65807.1 DUF922 domain-containing protein [bacterium M00.F.Ca.ET.159.01.1.1]TGT79465.1 DUF922 domain-cont
MRLKALTCLVAVGALCAPASAGSRIQVETRTYDVSGVSGAALIVAINRKGPKRGFMTHAIAQTSYTANWDMVVLQNNGSCRVRQASGTMNLVYTFPRVVSPMTPVLRQRWSRFFAGVRAHEETHGRIARQMMREAERSVAGLEIANDSSCNKARSEARRRIEAVYAQYEAKQNAFDVSEHREGGHVEHLVMALIKP